MQSTRHQPSTILDLGDYLEAIDMADSVPAGPTACEVCGSGDAEPLRDTVRVTDKIWTRFIAVCCSRCGFMYQTPRFAPAFYRDYYAHLWRKLLFGDAQPTDDYVSAQSARGALLVDNLAEYLPARGQVLDVGCGVGALMKPLLDRGWSGFGVDPDEKAIAHGASLGLPVAVQAAEEIDVEAEAFDFIIITGSLEHVYDPNAVLQRCRRAAAPGSLLLIEGHGLGQAELLGALGHSHRRFLTGNSIELFMRKHGWTPILTTRRELCGPTRPGSVFVLGRRSEPLSPMAFAAEIASGHRETFEHLKQRLDSLAIA